MTEPRPQTTLEPSAKAPSPAFAAHARLRDSFDAQAEQHATAGNRISLVRLVAFVAGAALITAGIMQRSQLELALGLATLGAFIAAVVLHARTIAAQTAAEVRRDLHARHLHRLGSGWKSFESRGEHLLPRDHDYAWDIDVVGPSSLFQRIDVTHTQAGERTLASWLGAAAPIAVARERQAAVRELADALELRQELEAAAGENQKAKLDGSGVEALATLPSLFAERKALHVLSFVLPACALALYVAGELRLLPKGVWMLVVAVQIGLLMQHGAAVRRAFDVVSARLPVLEGFEQMLLVVERAKWNSELLRALQARLSSGDVPPSESMRRLRRWAGFAELRHNFLFHVVINAVSMWDLHVLAGLERFVRDVGQGTREWFVVLGELEALASLATLSSGDPDATYPELQDVAAPIRATKLVHPLLSPAQRVDNDVTVRGPGTALVITGSNMAGKSTLLRAVGQNLALALAGGPVIAQSMSVCSVRLRASMRAEDSLSAGASYFHAELEKLRRVVEDAENPPPVFFLLDELLRGTNARARHVGAKAVLLHLLDRAGMGLVATHDLELAAIGQSEAARIENVHFTDVIVEGEMRFDYKLRAGIVRTSNALRLLAMAGIDVPAHEREALEGTPAGPARGTTGTTGTTGTPDDAAHTRSSKEAG